MRRGGRPRSAARTAEGQEQQGPSMALSQATQGVVSGSPPEGTSRDRFLERAVGTCPMVDLKIRGVLVSCLLDTGSQVSTITEGFFREHLSGNESDVLSTSGWLKITAANGLDIPYLGYMELDVEVMGMTLPECGFLIFKETPSSSSMAVLIGMNIISKCRQIVHAEFDTTLGGRLDSNWRVAFQQAQSVEFVERSSFARVAGKTPAHVPAWSAATVLIKGIESNKKGGSAWLVEPVNTTLPEGLVVVPTLVTSEFPVCPVRVLNLSQEDLWLQPRARLGMLSLVDCSNADSSCEVKFQRISADTERVTVGVDRGSEPPIRSALDHVDMGGTPEQQVQLKAVLEKYLGVFALDDDDLGYTDKVQHEINLTDDIPVNQPYRRVPPNQYQEVREHITKLLKKGVIQESVSAYASPVVLVRKADGSLRLCVDYRKLNAKTRRDAFPLPRIDESFDALREVFLNCGLGLWLSSDCREAEVAPEKAREYSEEKALERVSRLNEKAFCPQVGVGELVYLRQRLPGRNKIQDAWSPVVYGVVEIIGTTYTVEPLEGGPSKRVHRSELRPGAVPTPRPRSKDKSQPDTQNVTMVGNDTSEPDFVVVEEVVQPSVKGATNTQVDLGAPGTLGLEGDSSEGNPVPGSSDTTNYAESDGEALNAEVAGESDHSKKFETGEMLDRIQREVPVPVVRRSKRATAGVHTNPFHAPRSACHAVSVSTDMVSQVLTSIGTALFEKALRGAINTEFINE
ncbi:Retrovirus-related Pol poly from transposon [Labeo rohita]|uniref:Retrovirus-related Pol poly from transposon n=1 Tax=Labeo rohita TaxID=84645 RepID=A0A498LN35_LABRO|nr:Retrovirus-related Pol poly from transposon [Labeo rohita]